MQLSWPMHMQAWAFKMNITPAVGSSSSWMIKVKIDL